MERVCPNLKDFLLRENNNLGILSFKWVGNNLLYNNTIPAIVEKFFLIIHSNKLFSTVLLNPYLFAQMGNCVLLFFNKGFTDMRKLYLP